MNKINLRSLARELAVSPATLYRVINNSENVSAPTRQRVLGALRNQGFFTTELPHGRNILFDLNQGYIREHIGDELMRRLLAKNYNCQVVSLRERSAGFCRTVEKASVAVLCNLPTELEIARIRDINPDITIINVFGGNCGDVSINPDDWSGGELAANYLYENGHRHVAVFSRAEEPNHLVRLKSFFAENRIRHPEVRVESVIIYSRVENEVPEYADYLLGERGLPSAIFFTSRMLCNYFCGFAAKYRPELLERISLLTYDRPWGIPDFYKIDYLFYSFETALFWAEYYVINYPLLPRREPNRIRISIDLQKNGGVEHIAP